MTKMAMRHVSDKGGFQNRLHSCVLLFWIICLTMPDVISSQFSSGGYQTPQSPCPQVFQYQSNGYEMIGVGQILPGQYQVGGDILMMAHLIVGSQLPTNYYGKIKFTGSPEQIVNQMYNNEPIQFEIKFPTQDPLPTVSAITVNGNSICTADQYAQPSHSYFTRVTLQYMFKPIVSPNYRPRPSSPFGNGNTQRPNNIFTIDPQKKDNNNGFTVFQIQSPQATTTNNNQGFPHTSSATNPQPDSDTSIHLISHNNNFGFDLSQQVPTPTTAPPPSPVNNLPTRTQTPSQQATTNYDIGCGRIPKPFTPLVYGGTTVAKGDWPFIAALHHYAASSLKFKCGATIISRTTIISAAHCFYNRKQRLGAEDILAFIGHFNLKKLQEDGSRIINLASVVIHPDYRTQTELYSDIAVGKLSESLVFSEFIQPACLWSGSPDQSLIVGRNGVIVGWGLDESGMQTAEPKRVEVPVVSDQKCLRSHEGFGKITSDRTFCAGWRNGSEGPCAGDSGSGLMLNQDGMWFLRGLVSVSLKDSNTGTCDLNEFVVFTDAAQFVSWITSLL